MADKPKKSGRQNYDWNAIKHDYVTDPDATLRKIADKYGIRRNTVYKKSKAEGWFATRKKVQAEIGAKAIAETTDRMAAELSQESDFLQLMKGHMDRMLTDSQQFRRQTYVDPITGNLKEKVCNKTDTRAMKDSMQILTMMESMTRSLYNIQKAESIIKQQNDAERLAIERERLELEKERIALERERNALRRGNMDADEDTYGVVILPEILPEVMPNE